MQNKIKIIYIGLFLIFFQTPAHGSMFFQLEGVSDPNNTADVLFNYTASSTASLGKIDISIKNTSTSGPDPRITSFAFNTPSAVSGISNFTGTTTAWGYSYSPDTINTPGQFGLFDVAGLTGPNLNGGTPNAGIPINTTFNFSFFLTGSGLNTLTDSSFLSQLSYLNQGQPDPQSFIARFQRTGLNGKGSDVAIPAASVPEPASMLLVGTGLIGLLGIARRKKK